MKKILIVGGVAGGASFAARMRRLDETAQIVMFEKGEYISFANCGLPYHIGETIRDRENLIIQTPEKFKERFNVDVRTQSEVIAIDKDKKSVTVKHGSEIWEEPYDYLILSPGAAPIRPPLPGIDHKKIFTLRTIPDMDRIKEQVDKNKIQRAAVIGGGFIGLEMAENLRHRGVNVSLIELTDQVFAPADKEMAQILHQHMELNSVQLFLGKGAESFSENSDGSLTIHLKSGEKIKVDIVILAIGVKPDTEFVKKAGIAVNERGLIIVDDHLKTSAENVYAVGDAIEVTDFVSGKKVHLPLAGPANRQARIVADVIFGINSTYKNTQGTAICKVFDLAAAVTGLSEKNAKRFGITYLKSYTHSASHAGYYPGSFPLSIKVLFAPDTGKLLGAQVIGKIGVDKRIDLFATAVRHGLTVDDLAELELSYAPPYGSARDAVNIAGLAAQNIMRGITPVWFPEDISNNQDDVLLDVRTVDEFRQGTIDGAINIPVDELRKRIGEVPTGKNVKVFCQVGLRGHVATRILLQHGFNAINLSGGYKTFTTFKQTASESDYLQPVAQPVCSSPSGQILSEEDMLQVDACGLQCPGPILKLKNAIDNAKDGQLLRIKATDQGFTADIPSWCTRTGNSLVTLGVKDGLYEAVIRKGKAVDVCKVASGIRNDKKTLVIFSNDFDKMMAAFVIANGAASTGSEVTLFFTFWGLNVLRKDTSVSVKKNLIEQMFGMMMPRGAKKVSLSKMNMGGMGTFMMQKVMLKKNVYSLETLMQEAQKNGVRFVACSMSMDIMGIRKEELIDGVEIGGVASYLEKADESSYNLFI